MITEYVERLARELDFDPSLSRRVQREVEDHLWEAVSADPSADRSEAERRAVSDFGDPRAIAAQFQAGSLAGRARRAGVSAVLLIGAVFAVMKARFTWYSLTQWPPVDRMRELAEVVVSVDRWAFWLAFVAGTACWLYIERIRVPAALGTEYRARLGRFVSLCSVATVALIASVVSDGVLTVLRLWEADWSVAFVLPVLSMAVEIACAGLLVLHLLRIARPPAWTREESGGQ